MKLIDAMNEQDRNGQPQSIRAGRCEEIVHGSLSAYGAGGYCGTPGRWLVGRKIYCGPHGRAAMKARMEMKLTIRVLSADDDESSAYVREFDPDANEGRGHVGLTGDPKKAKTFGSQREAWEFWRQQSKVRPLRPDGKPNRPLTAFSIAIEPLG